MILLDTCALVWWTMDPQKLSQKAVVEITQVESLFVSSISIWEIGIKMKQKKLVVPLTIQEFVHRLKKMGSQQLAKNIGISRLN